MHHLEIRVRVLGPLLVGGQTAPSRGGDKASAHDASGRPIIPASSLRGALRIELERLFRGRDGDDAVCGANREPSGASEEPCGCPVCRLFGQEGHGIGTLRIEDGLLDSRTSASTSVRPHVAVNRHSGTAVSGHLAFLEATTAAGAQGVLFRAPARLVARGPRDTDAVLTEDRTHLGAACAALTALGGGKARGFGWVECSLEEVVPEAPGAAADVGGLETADGLRITFEARAPLHFGAGRPLGGFLPTGSSAPGSTVRGAIAFGLLEQGICTPEDARFRELVEASEGGVSFGSARAEGDRPSATRRKCRPNDHVFDDLVGELVRRAAAAHGVALALRPEGACPRPECAASKAIPWAWRGEQARLDRRVRTRTGINRRTGTSMDRKLYSVEVLEPRLLIEDGSEERAKPLTLDADIRGLSPATVELLGALDGRNLWLGGRRSRGMGKCGVRLAPIPVLDPARARQAVESLTRTVVEAWSALGSALGMDLPPLIDPGERLLALVLEEPWTPAADGSPGDLEPGPLGSASALALPFHRFLSLSQRGRFGAVEASRYGAPQSVTRGEAVPVLAAEPGSTYVYRVRQEALEEHLAAWLALGRAGSGVQREIGWGRFHIRGPETDF